MGKKLQIVFWLIIAIIAFILLGGVIYNLARATYEDPIHPEVTFEIANLGTIKMELYQEYAPNTVANFIKLVERGYYDTDKVLYGKDDLNLYFGVTAEGEIEIPQASLLNKEIEVDSEEDFQYSIPGEFAANGFNQNTLCHEKGVVTLMRESYGSALLEEGYNSGVSQIGIVMKDTAASLNGVYAAFGRITEGLDLLEEIYNNAEIAAPEVNEETGEPIETGVEAFATKYVVSTSKVDTHGIDFGYPQIVERFNYDEYVYQMFNSQYGN